jgi:archaellum component FlaF (FlaF/FlaG flagellin family)
MSYEIKVKYPYLTAAATVVILGLIIYSGSEHNQNSISQANQARKQHQTASPPSIMTSVANTVAADVEEQYNIVKRNNGTAIELSVKAGLVAEAYLNAHDEANYRKWKDVEKYHSK